MANRTVKDAKSIRGTNPQYLIEKIIRARIYDSKYWKEDCFALTSELLVDKAMELRYIGGVFGGHVKPCPFLCLLLKMLQIQPEKEIVVEFIKNEEFKYVRALGAFYMRLTGTSVDCYKYLEPLYNDNRKLRRQRRDANFELIHIDEYIDELLREERLCDIILPRIQKRYVLEENNELEPKISPLDDDLEADIPSEDEKEMPNTKENGKPLKKELERIRERRQRSRDRRFDRLDVMDRKWERSRSRERREREREKEREWERDKERERERDLEWEREREKEREKEREREKDRDRDREKRYRERDRSHRSRDRQRDRDRR